jgi:hypothetical protein
VSVAALTLAPGAFATVWYPSRADDNPGLGCVANGGAGNSCSLRQAIAAAQDGDTVSLAPPAPAGPYVLSNNPGVLAIGHSITLAGVDARQSVIHLTPANSNVVQVGTNVTAMISGVEVTGGNGIVAAGGGIYTSSGSVTTLDGVLVTGNAATGFNNAFGGAGGGIYNGATMTIENSTITNNQSASAIGFSG